MKRRIVVFLVIFGLFLWSIRVINLNIERKADIYYIEYGKEFYYGPLAIKTTRFLLLTCDEYKAKFGVAPDKGEEDKILCLQFQVRNDSEGAIAWDDIFSVMGEGFEGRGWYSSYDPYMGAKVNIFSAEELLPGETESFWMITTMAKTCFREKTWNNLLDMEFEYVMSMYPEAVRIRLHTPRTHMLQSEKQKGDAA